MNQRVLVTGAAGRLGSAVTAQLQADGYDFLATDRVDLGNVRYDFRQTDLLDHAATRELMTDVELVIHIGNHPGIGTTPPQEVFNQNTTMNTNVFQGAAESGVTRIIFASTLQLIGTHPDTRTVVNIPPMASFPLDGDVTPRPANLYALSKVLAEHMLRYYADRCGITCIALRLPLLHNHDDWVGVDTGAETSTDINEGFTGLSYRDAAALFTSVIRADLAGYRSFMAGTTHRHNDLNLPSLIDTFYPHLRPDLKDLIDNTSVRLATDWQMSDNYDSRSKDTPT